MIVYKGRTIVGGIAVEGEALVSKMPFGFFGGVNPKSGIVIDKWHELYGENIKDKILIYPQGRGSTVGAAIILELARCGYAPKAILSNDGEIITATGGILSEKFYDREIPMMDQFECDITESIKTGDLIRVNPPEERVEVIEQMIREKAVCIDRAKEIMEELKNMTK